MVEPLKWLVISLKGVEQPPRWFGDNLSCLHFQVDKVLRILKFMRKVKSLPKLEDVALIHPLVTRILGKNPGFATLQVRPKPWFFVLLC